MNKIIFGFNIPITIFIVLTLFSLIGTYFYYRRLNPQLERKNRILLGTLRFLALFFLFFFLAEPIATIVQSNLEKPKILVLFDNSSSMRMKWENIDKKQQTTLAYNVSGLGDFKKYPIEFWGFDTRTYPFQDFYFDSLRFEGEETNISLPLQRIQYIKQEENIQGIILFSDGIYNSGENPIYSAEKIGIPIYTIGIGDTVPPKDILISNIITSEIGFVGKTQPIKVSIKSHQFDKTSLKLMLYEEQSLLDQKIIELTNQLEDYAVVFEYTPKTEGFKKITVRAENLPQEFTYENNSQTQMVKILKSKRKYIILSGYPNPDIPYIKSIISSDEGTEVVSYIQKYGEEFYEPRPSRKEFETAEIFVLVGFPIASSPTYLLDWVREESLRGKSILFIPNLNVDYKKLKPYEDILPFNVVSNNPREFTFFGFFNPAYVGHPILNVESGAENIKILNQLPPIFRTELFVKPKPESEVLATVKVNDVELKEPFLIASNFQNRKSVAFLGYGLYRWRLLGFSLKQLLENKTKEEDYGSILISNIFKWLSTTEEFTRIKIKPSKTRYNRTENVVFNAQIFDAAFSPIDNALVKVKIAKGEQQFETILQQVGSGLYTSQLGVLAEGDYTYLGEVFVGNNKIGDASGKFIVEKSNLEFADFRSKFELLRYLSRSTNGMFFYWNETKRLKDELNNIKLDERVTTKRKEILIWNSFPLLFVSILLFAIEWFIRRQKGLL
ncbi:MAG: VWA domain-containing protein [Ignavibacteria bacterium]|nr:VWA domain-containing protein [Ignavibacteria bacterium]